MAWVNLREDLEELFGEATIRADAMLEALNQRRLYDRAIEQTRNAQAGRKAYKAAWARAQRRARGLKRLPAGTNPPGWAGLSAAQKERHADMKRARRARQLLTVPTIETK